MFKTNTKTDDEISVYATTLLKSTGGKRQFDKIQSLLPDDNTFTNLQKSHLKSLAATVFRSSIYLSSQATCENASKIENLDRLQNQTAVDTYLTSCRERKTISIHVKLTKIQSFLNQLNLHVENNSGLGAFLFQYHNFQTSITTNDSTTTRFFNIRFQNFAEATQFLTVYFDRSPTNPFKEATFCCFNLTLPERKVIKTWQNLFVAEGFTLKQLRTKFNRYNGRPSLETTDKDGVITSYYISNPPREYGLKSINDLNLVCTAEEIKESFLDAEGTPNKTRKLF